MQQIFLLLKKKNLLLKKFKNTESAQLWTATDCRQTKVKVANISFFAIGQLAVERSMSYSHTLTNSRLESEIIAF